MAAFVDAVLVVAAARLRSAVGGVPAAGGGRLAAAAGGGGSCLLPSAARDGEMRLDATAGAPVGRLRDAETHSAFVLFYRRDSTSLNQDFISVRKTHESMI